MLGFLPQIRPIRCWLVVFLVILLLPKAFGGTQPEYVFDSAVGDLNTQVDDARFMEIGKTSLWLGVGLMTEFNDNINLDPKNGKSDIILRPNVYCRILRPVTKENTLNIITRIGTSRYLSNSQYNSSFTTISPDSIFSYVFLIKEIKFTLLNRFSIQQDATTSPLINKTVNYNRRENGLGLNAAWSMNERTEWTCGINKNDLTSTSKEFKSLSRTVYRATIGNSYRIINPVWIGPSLGVYTEKYKQKVQNNSSGSTMSLDAKLNFTDYTKATLSAGIDKRKYKPTGTIVDSKTSANNFIFNGSISNRITPLTEHSLSFSSQPKSGYGTNYYSDFQSTYGITTKITYRVSGGINLIYQKTKTSGNNPESAKRYFATLNLDFNVIRDVACSLQFRNLRKKSNISSNSYTENKIILDIAYSI